MAIQIATVTKRTVLGDEHVNYGTFAFPNPYTTGGGDSYTKANIGLSSIRLLRLSDPVFEKGGVLYICRIDDTNLKVKAFVISTGVEAGAVDLSGVAIKFSAHGQR